MMEDSSLTSTLANTEDEQSQEASTKTGFSQPLQQSVDNNPDASNEMLVALTESFTSQLVVNGLEEETGKSASSIYTVSESQQSEKMVAENPRPISTGGANASPFVMGHLFRTGQNPAIAVADEGKSDVLKNQKRGAPVEGSYHGLPIEIEKALQTVVKAESEEIREAKEVYLQKVEKENKDLRKCVQKQEQHIEALKRENQDMHQCMKKRNEEFKQRRMKETKKVKNLKQKLNKALNKLEKMEIKLAQEVRKGKRMEKMKKEVYKENNTLHQNATFLTQGLRNKTSELNSLHSQYIQVQQNLQQFRDEVLGSLHDAQTTSDEFRRRFEESVEIQAEKSELIRKLKQMYDWKVEQFERLKEHIQEQDQQYQNDISEMAKLRIETQEYREELNSVKVQLDNQKQEFQEERERERQEERERSDKRMEELSEAFLKAETDNIKEMKHTLANEKQKVKRLKLKLAIAKSKGERMEKRNKNVCKRHRRLWAHINELRAKDRGCEARDDEQSWSTVSDEEEAVEC